MLKATTIRANRSAIHTNKPLTNLLIAHYQDQTGFLAEQVFPSFGVSKSTDIYRRIPKGAMNRNQVQKRARGAKLAEGGYTYDEDTYKCETYGLKVGITDEDDMDMDEMLSFDNESTFMLSQQVKLNRELEFTDMAWKTGVWGNDRTGVAANPTSTQFLKFSDDASDPIRVIKDWKTLMLESTGFLPNQLAMSYKVFDTLTEHPDILDRVKYGQTAGAPAMVTAEVLAQLFGIDELVVGRAIHNQAVAKRDETDADADHKFIIGDHMLLHYKSPVLGLRTPTSGLTMTWRVYSEQGFRMRDFRDDEALTDYSAMDDAFVQKIVSPDLGVFAADVI